MNKYDPKISDVKRQLFNDIRQDSQDLAHKNELNYVDREMSLYIVMKMNEKIITKMKDHDIDSVSFYHELYFKYEELSPPKGEKVQLLGGDDWKKLQEPTEYLEGDTEFLTVLGKNLANPRFKSINTILWNTVLDTVIEANDMAKTKEADSIEKDYYWSPLMAKYLMDKDGRMLFDDPEDAQPQQDPADEFQDNDSDMTQKPSEIDAQDAVKSDITLNSESSLKHKPT